MPAFISLLLICFALNAIFMPIHAGISLDAGINTKFLSARPLDVEPTPNYQGSGAAVRVGYYLTEIFNLSLSYDMAQSSTDQLSIGGSAEAYLEQKGVVAGFRLAETVFIGLSYDQGVFSRNLPKEPDGLANQYKTNGIGLEIGSFLLANRRKMRKHNLQFFLKVQTLNFETNSSLYPKTRTVDTIGIGFYYSFTGRQSKRSGGSLIQAFF